MKKEYYVSINIHTALTKEEIYDQLVSMIDDELGREIVQIDVEEVEEEADEEEEQP